MSKTILHSRRSALRLLATTGLAGLTGWREVAAAPGAMIPGKGWVEAGSATGDGTPLQFIPKRAPDADPLSDEFTKFPSCPYCGMSRTQWNHSRHLVHYNDDLADGTCSIHCLAISLALNLDRGPQAIYAADFGSTAEIKPLVNVDQATYLVGAELPGTMTAISKMAFASADTANAVQAAKGGHLVDFDGALREAYLGMATDTAAIRKRRAEKRKRMQQMQGKD